VRRREFLQALAAATVAGMPVDAVRGADAADGERLYGALKPFGNVALLHLTDCHAQLRPVRFREPSVNLGAGEARGKPPHVVGEALLRQFGIERGTREAYAFNFFLEPGCRGAGSANEFLSRFEQHLRSRGFERAWGFVASQNKPARWLYSLCGWRPQKVINSVEIARCLLFSETGVFVRNSRRRKVPLHGYRRVA